MAELHVIGRLEGAEGFGEQAIFCKWSLQHGSGWRVIAGLTEGQTQVDRCCPLTDTAIWGHPLDLHLACRGLQGWPRLLLQVYREDRYGRRDLCGYGVACVPSRPGHHTVTCHTWRPVGTFMQELRRAFVGGSPQLVSTEPLYNATERFRLHTVPTGTIKLELGVIMRDFDKHGVMY